MSLLKILLALGGLVAIEKFSGEYIELELNDKDFNLNRKNKN